MKVGEVDFGDNPFMKLDCHYKLKNFEIIEGTAKECQIWKQRRIENSILKDALLLCTKGTVNVGEIANETAQTVKVARAQQRKVIKSVENGEVALKTTKRKGNYGEMKMDDFFESQTYTRISDDRVLTLDQKIVKGIDGVYENPSPPPKYIIAEAKYNTSKLSNTKDGFQMSEDWILGSNRLEDAVGAEIAEKIRDEMVLNPENVAGLLVRIDRNGNVTESVLDSFGKVVK